jgi:hypothetical protein
MVVDSAIIDCMSSLLAFDYSAAARRVRSVPDAQILIDLVDLVSCQVHFQYGELMIGLAS